VAVQSKNQEGSFIGSLFILKYGSRKVQIVFPFRTIATPNPIPVEYIEGELRIDGAFEKQYSHQYLCIRVSIVIVHNNEATSTYELHW
jgi:hypothetical protein